MADESTTTTPPAQPVPPPAAPEPPAAGVVSMPSDKLRERLAEAQGAGMSKLLKEFGFKDKADAEQWIKDKRAADDAQKSEIKRVSDRNAELEAKAARADALEAVVEAHATTELGMLSPEQRAVIEEATDDHEERLALVSVMRRLGTLPAATAPATPPAAPPGTAPSAPATPPATTTPPARAPSEATTSPPDHKKVWRDLQTKNPVAASHYLLLHQREIFPEPA